MNKGKLLELAGQLMLAGVTHQDEEIEKISEQLAAELRQTNDDGACAPPPADNYLRGFLKFTIKEISKMPKSIRRTFIAEGQTSVTVGANAATSMLHTHMKPATAGTDTIYPFRQKTLLI